MAEDPTLLSDHAKDHITPNVHHGKEEEPPSNGKSTESIADSNDSDLELAPVKTKLYLSDLQQGIVGWDSPEDPENPMNFTKGKKWLLIGLISLMTFVSPLASSMFSPAMEKVAVDFQETNKELLSFTVSVFLLGYAFGPLFLAPLCEIYGRRVVLDMANWFFTIWQIGCAKAPNMTCLIIFRLLAGIGGSGCITLGAGIIADMFPTAERGTATAVWGLGPLLGPVLGPIMGGFIGQNKGWRWVFWVLLIISGAASAFLSVCNRETYAPVLIKWKTQRLQKETKRNDLRSAYQVTGEVQTPRQLLSRGLQRPLILLCNSPIMALLSTYIALIYGLMYLFFTTIPTVFRQDYHFKLGVTGLTYLGLGIGFMIGMAVVAATSDPMLRRLTARNNGVATPEMRLPLMIIFSCILPISFFWYGWTTDKEVFWLVPIIGMVPFSIGVVGIWMPIQTYVIDCYPQYAASANAALACARSVVGACLPIAGPKMFGNLGLGWGNSLLGFIALAFVPMPILFNRYGAKIRERFPINLD
ncbi:hypothetical protein KEM56_003545 [Ascosphaera pollenicola]|nr:hypothetical protein KEM56_003545 [Ascosphaera pollenicola]